MIPDLATVSRFQPTTRLGCLIRPFPMASPEDTVEQFQVAIDTVDRCLKATGAEARHVVKVNSPLTKSALDARGIV